MKVVHASWEQRNLGVDCNEITVEPDDDAETVIDDIRAHETEYTVVKIPTGCTDILHRLQQVGYSFIEMLTKCHHSGESFNLNRIQQRIVDRITYSEMADTDLEFMFREISGGLFRADRISMDPYFNSELANRRYVYWIEDELARNAQVFKVVYNEKDVGFFTLKRMGSDLHFAFLGGVYREFSTSGFGFCSHYCQIVEGRRQGSKRVMTAYSSNNRGAAAIHMTFGHVLYQQHYVLIKHI